MVCKQICDELQGQSNDLGSQLFRDFSIVHRFTKKYIAGRLRELGLTDCTPPYLMSIYHHPGITQEELSCFFKIDKGAVAKTSGQMIKNGYIHREQDSSDKRRYKLFLTKKGESAIPKLHTVQKDFAQLMVKGLTAKEAEQLQKLLNICALNLLTENGAGPAEIIETADLPQVAKANSETADCLCHKTPTQKQVKTQNKTQTQNQTNRKERPNK